MTINERIIQAVTQVIPVCVPDFYDPDSGTAEDEFCVFAFTETPDYYADDVPQVVRYSISVVLVMPLKRASLTKRNALILALEEADFVVQGVNNLSTDEFQQYEFHAEFVEPYAALREV